MKRQKLNLLVGTDVVDENDLTRLFKYSKVYKLSEQTPESLANILPQINCLLVFSWPKELTPDNLQKMTGLRFIQSILAGVNHIPFASLKQEITVSSNAGSYSEEVAEYAWGLLLSAAKRIVELHVSLREEKWTLRRTLDKGSEVSILKDKVIGILGYGGIGTEVARIAHGFGLRVYAYTRKSRQIKGVKTFNGPKGLSELLRQSDYVVLALPLTSQTAKIIDGQRLAEMKNDGILVNIARGELADEKAVYDHLVANPSFRYATDVWWYRESRESLKTDFPFLSLPNFIGTPHVSGPSGLATGKPARFAVDNVIRFLRRLKPHNIVDRNEYLIDYPY